MKYHLITYGCQMNHSDSERIVAVLTKAGGQLTAIITEADLIIINACSVRQSAVDRIWGQTKNLKQLKKTTVLTGCVLEKDKQKFASVFDFVLDIKDLNLWPKLLGLKTNISDKNRKNHYLSIIPNYNSICTAKVPIMTGCNNFCTFCVVPYTRNQEVSRPEEEIIGEIESLVQRGCKEIWLLGQNVNSYSPSFPKLLIKINHIPGNFWLRFTTSHPKDFSNELIETIAKCEKVTEYLNLPVQSGDNQILKAMNRPYSISDYKNLITKIRQKIPNIALSTDVIVGFPGETKKQFQNTVDLFKKIKFDMAYIAQYSPRPGTVAHKLIDNVSIEEKKRREKILTQILKKTALTKNKKYVGQEIEVLVNKVKGDWLYGKSRTYKTVKFKGSKNLIYQLVKVKITSASAWGLTGFKL